MPSEASTTVPNAWRKGSSPSSSEAVGNSPSIPAEVDACAKRLAGVIAQARPVLLGCEPSLEGVVSAVGCTYLAHAREGQVRLASTHDLQPQLGEETVMAPSTQGDDALAFARRVLTGFASKVTQGCRRRRGNACSPSCDNACVQRLVLACASDDPAMPEVVHRYMRLGFEAGPRVRALIADERVASFDSLARSVLNECERTRQFVRFSHMADGSYAATFTPKANTIPLTASHFAARMATERFFVVDPRHQVAAFHDPSRRGCELVKLDTALAQSLAARSDLADDEPYVRAMWQRFYQGTTTPGRTRSQRGYDLQLNWMPKRFWDGLTEMAPTQDRTMLAVPERYAGHPPSPHKSGALTEATLPQSSVRAP